MKKIKTCVIAVLLLLPLLAPILIQPVKASNIWAAAWMDYQYNVDPEGVHHPIANLSTTTTLTDDTGMFTTKIALVVPVYDYEPYVDLDLVAFRTMLYFDSFAEGTLIPAYTPQVIFIIEKDTDGCDLNKQFIEWHKPSAYKGWSQGKGLQQNSGTPSTSDERSFWAFKALAFGVGLFSEPVSLATGLIGVAQSFVLGGPVNDLIDAGYEDNEADSYWGVRHRRLSKSV
jgi:hypothetical protein